MIISVITPTLNSETTLGEALESVHSQWEEGVEHLIIDAASKDGTVDVASRFPAVQITSEPDLGIYDGMNKGAFRSKGEWLLFVQSDDWLPHGALRSYLNAIQAYPEAHIICGWAEAIQKVTDQWIPVWKVVEKEKRELTVKNITLGEPMINARLIRREIFLKIGGFSLDYSLASDRDFLLRATNENLLQVVIEAPTYRYRWHAGSSTMNEGNTLSQRLLSENLMIADHHFKEVSLKGKKYLRCWRTLLHVQGAMNALECWKLKNFFKHMVSGVSSDPLWLASLLGEIIRSVPGFIARGCRSRTQAQNVLSNNR